MPSSNLTRVDAEARSAIVSVRSYEVTLDLRNAVDAHAKTFASQTVVHFAATPGSSTFIDIAAERLSSATLNGQALALESYDRKKLALEDLQAENVLVVEADARYMNTGEGLHRFHDPADGETYIYTQFEARDASRVFACFDQPDMKARFRFTVHVPEQWKVFSNTVRSNDVGSRDSITEGETWQFAETLPMATYITAVVAGPYEGVEDVHDGIPLGVYSRRSMRQYLEPDEILTITKQGFDFFHSQFDYRYPFGKYDQIFVPEFNAGAMENAGCVTISDDYNLFRGKQTRLKYETRADTILHEMAHMWFGDLVTMRWWDDLWLNESFAEWAGYWACANATQYSEAWTSFCTIRKAWGMRQDQLSSTHPVATEAPDVLTAEVNFDGITYAKGASLLKQLVYYVGIDAFLNGLRSYFKEHAYGNATLDDLLGALSEASGRELTSWADKWIQTSQVNTLRPVVETNAEGLYTSVSIEQTAVSEHPTLRPHRLALGLYDYAADGSLVLRDQIEVDVDGESTSVSALVGARQPALLLVNDGDHTYAKVRLDKQSWQTAVESLHKLDDSLARALVWSAAWDAVRDGELPTRDYVQLAVNALASEQTMGIVQAHIMYANVALERYSDPAWRVDGQELLANAAWQAAQTAEPGSDVQLVWIRAFSGLARSSEQRLRLKAVLEGEITLPGLSMDAELRWHLVQQLVAGGVVGETAIAAELDRDKTDFGAREAAAARAAIPTLEAKNAAWDSMLDESFPHQTALAMMRGFVSIDSSPSLEADMLAPFVDRYFDLVPVVWETRTSETAAVVTELLYPAWDVTQAMVDRTNAYLAERKDLPPAASRLLAEGRDGIMRALKARACDASAEVSS